MAEPADDLGVHWTSQALHAVVAEAQGFPYLLQVLAHATWEAARPSREGVVLDIDDVIAIIRNSDDVAAARARLIEVFELSEIQANYILDMPLRRLTRLSLLELETERDSLTAEIAALSEILDNPDRLRSLVSDELADVAKTHGTPRRTILLAAGGTEGYELL